MSAPTCPRCRLDDHVVQGFGQLRSSSWLCLRCYWRVRHLDRAVVLWRLGYDHDPDRGIRVTRRAA